MLLLGIDVESTGLDPKTDRVIELGAVLWDTTARQPVVIYNELVDPGIDVPPKITEITGITTQMLRDHGKASLTVFRRFHADVLMRATAFMAHNASFDRAFLLGELERVFGDKGEAPTLVREALWVDTMTDVPFPARIAVRKLDYLAAEHGFLNPFSHRAVFDVLTMLRIVADYDMSAVLARSREPSIELFAQTVKPWLDNGESNKKVKARGYRWHESWKAWTKTVKESDLQSELNHGEFVVTRRTP